MDRPGAFATVTIPIIVTIVFDECAAAVVITY